MEGFDHDGLRFDVSDSGPPDGRPVVLLHGFPADRTTWDAVTPALVADGHRVLAPDQRGYSPGARPPRRRDYRLGLLAADVLALADAAGADRFDVVGHDWGAVVALHLAADHPDRVRTVAAFAGPHPGAWRRSLTRGSQAVRSAYMVFFQVPRLPERLLGARSGARLYRSLVGSGLDREHARRYAARFSRPGALTGPLNWYRAAAFDRVRTGVVPVPTLLVRGGRDRFVTPEAVDLSRRWVSGPCRIETLDDVSHWIPEQAPARVAALIRGHL
ncbi:alpha/beta fold hydrolase [Virgisporangium ochraceum]|nr:alpha/beta fold hydrolase [Virgisporangium ochraceum]